MGELLTETRMTLTELARQEHVNVCTVWRWANRGARGVRLETFHIGGRRYTTRQAFARFVASTTAASQGEQPAPPSRSNRQREAAIARAEADLAKAGI
ncbi:MAG: DUF1580 domain-containing protein [Pirellulales bacterium]|nr:DUF1580 domain-containing protein [Pirellulales bacterium]